MKWISGLLCLVVGMTLGSCQSDDELQSSGQTGFLISLTDEFNQKVTRTTPEKLEKPVASQFKLRVTDADSGKEAYAGQCTESVLLKAGSYDLTATFGENPVIALDAPYYMGTKENQNVEEGKMTSVDIPCSVANALLSVTFDEESLKKAFEDYYVAVSVGSESVNVDATSGKSAYFRAGSSVELTFHGFMLGTGKEVTYDIPEPESEDESGNGSFTAIPAKTHVKVTLKFNGSVSTGAGISISKLQVDTVSIGKTLPLEMMPKPKLEAEGFENNELVFAETESKLAVINLKLASPLQDLKLKFNSDDAKFASLNREEGYLLSNPEDKAAVEDVLDIELPEIGATEAAIDFSSLVPQLMTDKGATVSSVIEVDAKANNRWSSDKETDASARTFTLKCNKPVFRVSAYPGNIWTKEFTVNHLLAEDVESGDYEVLGQKMRYQFSTNGTDDWTDLGEDLRKAELTPGTTYYIRGVYRDVIESEAVAVTTYSPIALENGGLEGAFISKGADKKSSEYGAEYKWSGWCTLNELTCDKCTIIFGAWGNTAYNSRSGTRPSTDKPQDSDGNSSAWIMTMGYGYGGTSPKHITPSELFLGSLSNVDHDNDTATKNYGIQYNSHPTGLRFYYKYLPYNNDKSDIYIQLLSDDGTILGHAELQETSTVDSFKDITLNIFYEESYLDKRISKMIVVFKSGFNAEVYNYGTGSEMGNNSAEPSHRGSELYIDDVSLVYDK